VSIKYFKNIKKEQKCITKTKNVSCHNLLKKEGVIIIMITAHLHPLILSSPARSLINFCHLNVFLILAFINCQLSGLNVSASSSPASEFISILILLDLEFISHLSSNTAAAITLPVCSPSVSTALWSK